MSSQRWIAESFLLVRLKRTSTKRRPMETIVEDDQVDWEWREDQSWVRSHYVHVSKKKALAVLLRSGIGAHLEIIPFLLLAHQVCQGIEPCDLHLRKLYLQGLGSVEDLCEDGA